MTKYLGLLYGSIAYLLFLAVFLYTIGFVEGLPGLKTLDSGATVNTWSAAVVDALLLGMFAIQHSVMARRGFKRWWTKIIAPSVERSTYVLMATLMVALMMWQWQPIPAVVWDVGEGGAATGLYAVSVAGWLLLLASTFLINHFELFGLQQVFNVWRGHQFAAPGFRTPALYRFVRHPLYLGFIVAFWASPRMTVGHLYFSMATTAYIFVGIFFEERDLIAHFGEQYRAYKKRVPMIVPWFTGSGAATEEKGGRSRVR